MGIRRLKGRGSQGFEDSAVVGFVQLLVLGVPPPWPGPNRGRARVGVVGGSVPRTRSPGCIGLAARPQRATTPPITHALVRRSASANSQPPGGLHIPVICSIFLHIASNCSKIEQNMITGPEFELFEKNHGYAPLQALKNASVHTSRITKLLGSGAIVKIAPGFYRLANIPLHPHQSLIDICMFMNQAVVCLHSALSYYELTTASPISVMIALPRSSKPKKMYYPVPRVFHFSTHNYESGVETTHTESGIIRIYSREKSIVDAFRFRNRLGLDVALESLREYMNQNPSGFPALVRWAKQGRMFSVMRQYLEVYAG